MSRCEAQIKSFSVQQFFKNAAEVWASSPHLRSKLFFNKFSLLQLHFLKLCNSNKVKQCEPSCKFGQGNGAIAARWQAKAGVEPPFAGCERLFSLEIIVFNQQAAIEKRIAIRGCVSALPEPYADGFLNHQRDKLLFFAESQLLKCKQWISRYFQE